MNKFYFVGHIKKMDLNKFIKKNKNGSNYIRFPIYQNKSNFAYVQMFGESHEVVDKISVFDKNGLRKTIDYKDRNNPRVLSSISNRCKYKFNFSAKKKVEYVLKNDFIEYFYNFLQTYPSPENLLYEITGEFKISFVDDKVYYNFNIRNITINEYGIPQLKLQLDLFYNYQGLNIEDKRNKLVLNSFVYQYSYLDRKCLYYPLQVYFATNVYNLNNSKDIKIIESRSQDMSPLKKEGYVKSCWEAYYKHGADLINLDLNKTKELDENFKRYTSSIFNLADDLIYLTHPVGLTSTNKNIKHYWSLNITNNEFENRIYKLQKEPKSNVLSLDKLIIEECQRNPFN